MDVDPNPEDDVESLVKYVATKTERLVFTWPIRYWITQLLQGIITLPMIISGIGAAVFQRLKHGPTTSWSRSSSVLLCSVFNVLMLISTEQCQHGAMEDGGGTL